MAIHVFDSFCLLFFPRLEFNSFSSLSHRLKMNKFLHSVLQLKKIQLKIKCAMSAQLKNTYSFNLGDFFSLK